MIIWLSVNTDGTYKAKQIEANINVFFVMITANEFMDFHNSIIGLSSSFLCINSEFLFGLNMA